MLDFEVSFDNKEGFYIARKGENFYVFQDDSPLGRIEYDEEWKQFVFYPDYTSALMRRERPLYQDELDCINDFMKKMTLFVGKESGK